MKKTVLAILLALALVMMPLCSLAEGGTIVILTPTEDHGWTGSVATFAQASADEINSQAMYTAELLDFRRRGRADRQDRRSGGQPRGRNRRRGNPAHGQHRGKRHHEP